MSFFAAAAARYDAEGSDGGDGDSGSQPPVARSDAGQSQQSPQFQAEVEPSAGPSRIEEAHPPRGGVPSSRRGFPQYAPGAAPQQRPRTVVRDDPRPVPTNHYPQDERWRGHGDPRGAMHAQSMAPEPYGAQYYNNVQPVPYHGGQGSLGHDQFQNMRMPLLPNPQVDAHQFERDLRGRMADERSRDHGAFQRPVDEFGRPFDRSRMPERSSHDPHHRREDYPYDWNRRDVPRRNEQDRRFERGGRQEAPSYDRVLNQRPPGQTSADWRSKTPCIFHKGGRGKCKNGNNCPFLHDRAGSRERDRDRDRRSERRPGGTRDSRSRDSRMDEEGELQGRVTGTRGKLYYMQYNERQPTGHPSTSDPTVYRDYRGVGEGSTSAQAAASRKRSAEPAKESEGFPARKSLRKVVRFADEAERESSGAGPSGSHQPVPRPVQQQQPPQALALPHDPSQRAVRGHFQKWRCRACDIKCPSKFHLMQHFQGKAHIQKVGKGRSDFDHLKAFGEPIDTAKQISLEASARERKQQEIQRRSNQLEPRTAGLPSKQSIVFRCRACNIWCNTKEVLGSHFGGGKHKEKVVHLLGTPKQFLRDSFWSFENQFEMYGHETFSAAVGAAQNLPKQTSTPGSHAPLDRTTPTAANGHQRQSNAPPPASSLAAAPGSSGIAPQQPMPSSPQPKGTFNERFEKEKGKGKKVWIRQAPSPEPATAAAEAIGRRPSPVARLLHTSEPPVAGGEPEAVEPSSAGQQQATNPTEKDEEMERCLAERRANHPQTQTMPPPQAEPASTPAPTPVLTPLPVLVPIVSCLYTKKDFNSLNDFVAHIKTDKYKKARKMIREREGKRRGGREGRGREGMMTDSQSSIAPSPPSPPPPPPATENGAEGAPPNILRDGCTFDAERGWLKVAAGGICVLEVDESGTMILNSGGECETGDAPTPDANATSHTDAHAHAGTGSLEIRKAIFKTLTKAFKAISFELIMQREDWLIIDTLESDGPTGLWRFVDGMVINPNGPKAAMALRYPQDYGNLQEPQYVPWARALQIAIEFGKCPEAERYMTAAQAAALNQERINTLAPGEAPGGAGQEGAGQEPAAALAPIDPRLMDEDDSDEEPNGPLAAHSTAVAPAPAPAAGSVQTALPPTPPPALSHVVVGSAHGNPSDHNLNMMPIVNGNGGSMPSGTGGGMSRAWT